MMMQIYMDASMICIWVTWRLMVFIAQHLAHLMLEQIHPTLGWIDLWLEKVWFSSHILCYIFMILSFMDVWVRLLWVIWSLPVFFFSLFSSDFGGGSSFPHWMKEHMDDYIDANYISFGTHYYSNLQQHSLLFSDDAHLHGCTYDMHLSHLKTHGLSCSTLG